MNNLCKQLCAFVILVFFLVSCAPSLSPSAYPNPVTASPNPATATLHPIAASLTEQILRTATPTAGSPVPPSQDFLKGDLAQVSLDEAQSLSEEEIVKLLMSQWLERYMKEKTTPEAITDYSIGRVTVESRLSDMEVIFFVKFSVIPVDRYWAIWRAFPGEPHDPNDPWFHIAGYFAIVQDGEFYKLRSRQGWGS